MAEQSPRHLPWGQLKRGHNVSVPECRPRFLLVSETGLLYFKSGGAEVLGGSVNRFQTLLGPEACSQGTPATFRPGSGCPWRRPPTYVPAVALA